MSGAGPREVNRAFYGSISAGRSDYWRLMPAPRHRVATIVAELRRLAPRSVVDLGCGGGQLLAEIARAGLAASRAGVDLSEAQIEENRRADPSVEWHALDLEADGPLPESLAARADTIVASELIEHLGRPERLLVHARGLAAPGGAHLILSTQSGPVRQTERRVGHRRHFSADEMRRLLLETGWTEPRVWNTGFPFHDLSKWWANRDPDASLARFSSRAYGPAERAVCLALGLLFRLNSRRRGAQLFAVARSAPP